jgi:hypothetical protein
MFVALGHVAMRDFTHDMTARISDSLESSLYGSKRIRLHSLNKYVQVISMLEYLSGNPMLKIQLLFGRGEEDAKL